MSLERSGDCVTRRDEFTGNSHTVSKCATEHQHADVFFII